MKILLIESDVRQLAHMREVLQRCQYIVESLTDGRLGYATALHARFDLIVLEAHLPRLDGCELVRRLREEGDTTPVLMVSQGNDPADIARGLYAGADDYMAKPAHPDELLARLHALHRRRTGGLNALTVLRVANLELNMAERAAYRENQRIVLTAKEFELLTYLVENAGRIVTKAQILEKVWDSRTNCNTNKVEVYINFLRKKIDQGFDYKLIHTAMGVGYMLRPGL